MLVETVNVALVAPEGMVTEAGTCATSRLLLLSATVAPVEGAFPSRVTVPIEDVPPVTVLGFNVSALRPAAVTVNETLRVLTYTPVIVTAVEDETPLVEIVNVVLIDPAGTVTLAGT